MSAAAPASADGVKWEAFIERPAEYADPRRLAGCFGGTISLTACAELLATERLRGRLSRLLAAHYGLAPSGPVNDEDRAIALASAGRLADIALRAGAVYWADTIARTILGRAAAALQEEVGAEACSFAIANRDLAGPEQAIEPVETIGERIRADGWRCLGAWCRAVPAGVGLRVRLKLAPLPALEEDPVEPFAANGPVIVRRAAA